MFITYTLWKHWRVIPNGLCQSKRTPKSPRGRWQLPFPPKQPDEASMESSGVLCRVCPWGFDRLLLPNSLVMFGFPVNRHMLPALLYVSFCLLGEIDPEVKGWSRTSWNKRGRNGPRRFWKPFEYQAIYDTPTSGLTYF